MANDWELWPLPLSTHWGMPVFVGRDAEDEANKMKFNKLKI